MDYGSHRFAELLENGKAASPWEGAQHCASRRPQTPWAKPPGSKNETRPRLWLSIGGSYNKEGPGSAGTLLSHLRPVRVLSS